MSKELLTGILVPMNEEIEMILKHMVVEEVYEAGKRKFHKGHINGKACVVALSRIGKVASSVTAAVMIEHFKIDRLLVTGVAGAISSNVKIGDIVVATTCVQHDMDCRPLFPQFESPMLGKSFFECTPELTELAQKNCQDFLDKDFHTYIGAEYVKEFGIPEPKVHRGQLVSGDQFIGTMDQLNKIRTELPEAIFVEMEGAAVAQVCYEYNIPFVVIRSISDNADHSAHVDFGSYIEHVSKYYTWGLAERFLA